MSTSRHGCAGTEANGKLYICGGLYQNTGCDAGTVECYDPAQPGLKWSLLPATPKGDRAVPSLTFPACGTVRSSVHGIMVVMAGGEDATLPGSSVRADTFGFAVEKDEWVLLSPMATARSAAAFTVVECSWPGYGNGSEDGSGNGGGGAGGGGGGGANGSGSSGSNSGGNAVDVLIVAGGRGTAGESLRSVEMFDGLEWRPAFRSVQQEKPPPLASICSRTLMGCFVPIRSGGWWGGNPSVTHRCSSLLRSLSADMRAPDDVITFEGPSPIC